MRLQLGSRGLRKAAGVQEEVMQDKNLFLGFLKSLQPPAFSAKAFQAAQIPVTRPKQESFVSISHSCAL